MLVCETCDCWPCEKTRALARIHETCVYCRVSRDVYFTDDDGRPWCKVCANRFHAGCVFAIRHGKHDTQFCKTCPPDAIIDKDGDTWFPLPGRTDAYLLSSVHDAWNGSKWTSEGRPRKHIAKLFSPIRVRMFIVNEEADWDEASVAGP